MKPSDPLQLLKTRSLTALVQEKLEDMILEGQLLPGEQLRELSLAALLGISRGPIREAFRGLEEKGLVQIVKNCGVYVRTLALEEADQIYEVRIVLEALIGEKATRNLSHEGQQSLSAILADMESTVTAGDITRYTALNVHFHDTLACLSGNPKLHETYRRLVTELSLFRRQTYVHDEGSMLISLHEHQAIHAAVVAGKATKAAALLQAHAAASRSRLQQALGTSSPGTLPPQNPAYPDVPEPTASTTGV